MSLIGTSSGMGLGTSSGVGHPTYSIDVLSPVEVCANSRVGSSIITSSSSFNAEMFIMTL